MIIHWGIFYGIYMKKRLKPSPKKNILYYLIYFIYKIGYSISSLFSLILKFPTKIRVAIFVPKLFKLTNYILNPLIFFLKSLGLISLYLATSVISGSKRIGNKTVLTLKNSADYVTSACKKIIISFRALIKRSAKYFLNKINSVKDFVIRIKDSFSILRRFEGRKYFLPTLFLTLSALIIFFALSFLNSIPNPKALSDFSAVSSNQIFDKNNTLLFNSYNKENRIPVSISNVSPVLIKATVYSEDSRFYNHFGVDLIAIVRSIFHNLTHQSIQGGSTITQQLAKNVFLTSEKSLKRKVEEAILAFRIEQNFSKEQILELYINAISYGGDTVGIEAASQRYFDKKAKELSPKEAIYLASITSAPSIYAPSSIYNHNYKSKENTILKKMVANKDITLAQSQKIAHEKLVFSPQIIYKRAPHAVDYALNEFPKDILKVKNSSKGFLVQTTIDLSLQNYIQQNVLSYIAKEKSNNINNAGVIVINPHDGSILAMVGSANYFEAESGQYNTVLAKRQLGSAVKIVTYALALDTIYTPTSTIIDKPSSFEGFPEYNPRNYDGKFHGAVSLKSAFANSYNIPALTLAYNLGLRKVADKGVAMGIPEFEFKDNNIPLSFVIGGVELPLEHLASAYSVVANNGKFVDLHIINSVSDYDNKIIYKANSKDTLQVISPQTATNIFNILSDNNARLPAFGHSSDFDFGPNQVAIKTGTSNDDKDNVAMAFNKDFVVGVWIGNNNGESMNNIASGYVGATSIMHTVVTKVLDNIAQADAKNSVYALKNK